MMRAKTRKTIIVFILFLICAVISHIVLFSTFFNKYRVYFLRFEQSRNYSEDRDFFLGSEDRDFFLGSRLIINTQGCKIARTPIFPEYYKQNWHLEEIPYCGYENSPLSTLIEDKVVVLKKEYGNSQCCLHEITRLDNTDRGYNLSSCERFTTSVDVSKKEILLTKCGNWLTFDVNLPVKPSVKRKLDYWRNFSGKELPPSVLLFGIDTVSRSHALRSLPQTLGLMKKMGFVDFKGYHSIDAGTLKSFMGFLMGLLYKDVRNGCAPNFSTPYDACPFIWKKFSQQNYVTMYIEDGDQTFNYGEQTGFNQAPTDYYIHPLFSAITELRKNQSKFGNNTYNLDCMSNETVPEFVIRYHKRFVKKFQDVPFFSFMWLAYPFHNNQFTLGTLEKEIKGFLELLGTIPNLLERTFIVFLSDHGDIYSLFQTNSKEGKIEKVLPPLFIRFPKLLRNKFPDLKKVLQTNREALTSPLDLHHTFVHILSINEQKFITNSSISTPTSNTFQSVMADRVSLFVSADMNRTCDKLNIEPGVCVCGISLQVDRIKNPVYLAKIMEYAEYRLNKFVSSSQYYKVCAKWTATVDTIISSRILIKTENYTDHLIQFTANPGEAKFEVSIKVLHSINHFDGCELIGEFERVNTYGEQSSCVKFETDEDKRMKKFCFCK